MQPQGGHQLPGFGWRDVGGGGGGAGAAVGAVWGRCCNAAGYGTPFWVCTRFKSTLQCVSSPRKTLEAIFHCTGCQPPAPQLLLPFWAESAQVHELTTGLTTILSKVDSQLPGAAAWNCTEQHSNNHFCCCSHADDVTPSSAVSNVCHAQRADRTPEPAPGSRPGTRWAPPDHAGHWR